jgi:hypothetical protein
MSKMTLWGFDASTYVRTVKMVLAEKGYTDFEQVQIMSSPANRGRRNIYRAIRSARCRSLTTTACAFSKRRRSLDT